jgi:serine protease Do
MSAISRRAALAALALACGGVRAAGLPALIAAAKPSVLPIGTLNATDSPRFTFRGSGFVVGDGRTVVSAAHVLPGPEDVDALARLNVLIAPPSALRDSGTGAGERPGAPMPGAREARALKIVAIDRVHDVALLRFDAGAALPPLVLADAETAREGDAVALIGFPVGGVLGFAPVTHTGIVASLTTIALPAPTAGQLDARAVARLRDGNFGVLQLDAVAYPGNSGGPLLDVTTGRVIGVMNMVLVKGSRESALSAPTGISYAVPVRWVRELMANR